MIHYTLGQVGPAVLGDIDQESVVVISAQWSVWLASIGESAIDASSWEVVNAVLGDGATAVTKAGFVVTPPVPSLGADTTSAHVWLDVTTPPDEGTEVTVINRVRVGSRVAVATSRMLARA